MSQLMVPKIGEMDDVNCKHLMIVILLLIKLGTLTESSVRESNCSTEAVCGP